MLGTLQSYTINFIPGCVVASRLHSISLGFTSVGNTGIQVLVRRLSRRCLCTRSMILVWPRRHVRWFSRGCHCTRMSTLETMLKKSNLRPLLSNYFPQGFQISKYIGHPTSRNGDKKTFKQYLKIEHTDTETDKQTFRLIESIGPEGRCFQNIVCGNDLKPRLGVNCCLCR